LAKVQFSFAELEFAERKFEKAAASYEKVIYAIHHLPSAGVLGEFPLVPRCYLGRAKCYRELGDRGMAAICLLQAFDALGRQPSRAVRKLCQEIEAVTRELLATTEESRLDGKFAAADELAVTEELAARLDENRGPR
jgi:tetratricopeptide (TPR) repeat protein